jgi:hypothetical protein
MQNESPMQSTASGMLKRFRAKYCGERSLAAALLLAIIGGTLLFNYHKNNKVVSFDNPKYMLSALVPHGGYSETCVIAYGRFFNNVAGYKPYYLSNPNCNRIVIYTKPTGNHSYVANIINTADRSVVSLKIPGSVDFGSNIGCKSPEMIDRFECGQTGEITLTHKVETAEFVLKIDSSENLIKSYEIRAYDTNGIITNRLNALNLWFVY